MENLKFPIGEFQKPFSISDDNLKTWISIIENFPNRLNTLSENLSIEQLNWVYRPNGWTIKQVVHHCADSHMNSLIRFKLALTEDLPIIKPYEEDIWANLSDSTIDDISTSLKILEGVHTRWTLLLKSFTNVEFARQFLHPATGKIFNLDEALGLYAWHCNHHFAHIEQGLNHKNKF